MILERGDEVRAMVRLKVFTRVRLRKSIRSRRQKGKPGQDAYHTCTVLSVLPDAIRVSSADHCASNTVEE